MSTSESAMVREVMASDPEKNSIYVGDQGLGVYRSVQAAEASQHKVVLRIQKRMAKKLWKSIKSKIPLANFDYDRRIAWN
jgi:hypothetical protein